MLNPGTINGAGEWVEPHSMARYVEDQMVNRELISVDEETEEITRLRREGLIAMCAGIVSYLKEHMEIALAAGDIRGAGEASAELPASDVDLAAASVAGGGGGTVTVRVHRGKIRSTGEGGMQIPLSSKVLAGRVQ